MVLEEGETTTAHGGVIAIDALAKDFGLWDKLRACGLMDPRKDRSRGFGPEAVMAQLIFSLCSGGISLADAERLSRDQAMGKLVGVERMADESTLGEWLRGQSPESLRGLWRIIREFIAWVLERAKPGRVRHGGQLEVFFDDTQIEVSGHCFEGVGVNHEGQRAYSWQTLWLSYFVADGCLKPGNTDPSECLPGCLDATISLWEEEARSGRVHFYADSASSAGKYLNGVDQRGWSWTISYNKWTEKLDGLASALPEKDWGAVREATGRDGKPMIEQYGWVKHLPGEKCERAQVFAVVRYKPKEQGEFFWRYAYVVCGGPAEKLCVHEPTAARRVFERHHLKGAKEQGFHQLLSDLDLHHPPCKDRGANEFYYAVAALAFNLLMAFKVLHLDDDQQARTVRTLIRWWLTVPVKISQHAHRTRARIFVPKATMRWWRLFIQEKFPTRRPGRPFNEPEIVIQPSG
ncbi:MAG: transposase [Methanomassiliicoccales archaeon]